MSDIKLFYISDENVRELESRPLEIEKSLQSLIERHLIKFFAVRFLASEYSTGERHGGRIDTLGIDENHCPVIIEYKRSISDNVMNQGLFYLDWLMDHKAEFELLVLKKYGADAAQEIEWSSPRLVCIAGDFTKYDSYAVQQIDRTIELVRYRRYGDEFLILELVNAVMAEPIKNGKVPPVPPPIGVYKTVSESLSCASESLKDLFESLKLYVESLGDDVQMKTLKYYFAFKRIKNFATVGVFPTAGSLLIWVKLDPATVELAPGFTRDVSEIGHHGTGDLEITVTDESSLEKAKELLTRSYNAN